MCGIIGYISPTEALEAVKTASKQQAHRGPDANIATVQDCGPWKVHFAHQRLSVIDLSAGANQPFSDDKFSMIYNGEVYNYLEIREELVAAGCSFRTQSDTEVVFTAITHWGLESAVQRFNGMWAIAFLDKERQQLQLSRDRFGIKPLYYFIEDERLIWASEVKSILQLTDHRHALNRQTVALYLEQHLLESDPRQTFFKDILKLQPGHNATIDLQSKQLSIRPQRYYTLKPRTDLQHLSTAEASSMMSDHLRQAVALRLRSDVPVGVLLSGGLDSSTIAAVTNEAMPGKTQLLSYVSEDKTVDESPFIDKVATHLERDVKKVQIEVLASDIFQLLKRVTFFNDQPLHSFSAVAHYLLMEKAKSLNLTVILSGQGADESLCGYRKYLAFYLKYLVQSKKPFQAIKVAIGFLLNGTLISEFSFRDGKRYLPKFFSRGTPSILSTKLRSSFQPSFIGFGRGDSLVERQIRDIQQFSVPSLLHYEDRMSMAHSREIRVPFLDHQLVEFMISLKPKFKLFKGWTKYVLRLAAVRWLPREITWRKDKKGFTSPQGQWLKNDLRPKITEIFASDESPLYMHDLINKKLLLAKYSDYCSSERHTISDREIFAPLALHIWLEEFAPFIAQEK